MPPPRSPPSKHTDGGPLGERQFCMHARPHPADKPQPLLLRADEASASPACDWFLARTPLENAENESPQPVAGPQRCASPESPTTLPTASLSPCGITSCTILDTPTPMILEFSAGPDSDSHEEACTLSPTAPTCKKAITECVIPSPLHGEDNAALRQRAAAAEARAEAAEKIAKETEIRAHAAEARLVGAISELHALKEKALQSELAQSKIEATSADDKKERDLLAHQLLRESRLRAKAEEDLAKISGEDALSQRGGLEKTMAKQQKKIEALEAIIASLKLGKWRDRGTGIKSNHSDLILERVREQADLQDSASEFETGDVNENSNNEVLLVAGNNRNIRTWTRCDASGEFSPVKTDFSSATTPVRAAQVHVFWQGVRQTMQQGPVTLGPGKKSPTVEQAAAAAADCCDVVHRLDERSICLAVFGTWKAWSIEKKYITWKVRATRSTSEFTGGSRTTPPCDPPNDCNFNCLEAPPGVPLIPSSPEQTRRIPKSPWRESSSSQRGGAATMHSKKREFSSGCGEDNPDHSGSFTDVPLHLVNPFSPSNWGESTMKLVDNSDSSESSKKCASANTQTPNLKGRCKKDTPALDELAHNRSGGIIAVSSHCAPDTGPEDLAAISSGAPCHAPKSRCALSSDATEDKNVEREDVMCYGLRANVLYSGLCDRQALRDGGGTEEEKEKARRAHQRRLQFLEAETLKEQNGEGNDKVPDGISISHVSSGQSAQDEIAEIARVAEREIDDAMEVMKWRWAVETNTRAKKAPHSSSSSLDKLRDVVRSRSRSNSKSPTQGEISTTSPVKTLSLRDQSPNALEGDLLPAFMVQISGGIEHFSSTHMC